MLVFHGFPAIFTEKSGGSPVGSLDQVGACQREAAWAEASDVVRVVQVVDGEKKHETLGKKTWEP